MRYVFFSMSHCFGCKDVLRYIYQRHSGLHKKKLLCFGHWEANWGLYWVVCVFQWRPHIRHKEGVWDGGGGVWRGQTPPPAFGSKPDPLSFLLSLFSFYLLSTKFTQCEYFPLSIYFCPQNPFLFANVPVFFCPNQWGRRWRIQWRKFCSAVTIFSPILGHFGSLLASGLSYVGVGRKILLRHILKIFLCDVYDVYRHFFCGSVP